MKKKAGSLTKFVAEVIASRWMQQNMKQGHGSIKRNTKERK